MEEKKMITLTLENGTKEEVELLLSFKFNILDELFLKQRAVLPF